MQRDIKVKPWRSAGSAKAPGTVDEKFGKARDTYVRLFLAGFGTKPVRPANLLNAT